MNKPIDRTKSNLHIKEKKKKDSKIAAIKNERKKIRNDLISNANLIFGLDNGSTGTISCINKVDGTISFMKTPSRVELDYTQDIKYINRIDVVELKKWFETNISLMKDDNRFIIVILERPMKNPTRFEQSISACRAFEATLIVLEELNLKYIVIDSKQWQHYFFGKNTTNIDLKLESMRKGLDVLKKNFKKQYNEISEIIKNHGDADSLLICQYIIDQNTKSINNC